MAFQRLATTQKIIQKEEASEIVIQNPELSVQTALELMKKMTLIAVSTITYLRGVFPEDAFLVKKLEGQRVYVLKRHVGDAEILSKWLTSAFELINSHHLKKIFLVMKDGDVTLEIYTFSFSYDKDAMICDLRGEINGKEVILSQSVPGDISKSIRILIRALLVSISVMKPLPSEFDLSVKLHLDESTPEDKIPPVFKLSVAEPIVNFPIEMDTLKLGQIKSKFGTFGVTTKSVFFNENYENYCRVSNEKQNNESEDTEEVPGSQVEQMSSVLNISQSHRKFYDNKEPDNTCQLSGTSSVVSKRSENDGNLAEALSIVSLKEKTISCICECASLFDNTIQCASCLTFQHKTCYKLLECHNVAIHICVSCHDPTQGKICSIPELVNDVNRKESALYRLALMYCCTCAQLSCKKIMTHLKVPRKVAEMIFKQLDKNGCFEPATNKGHIRNVKLDLKDNVGQYFIAPPSSDSTHMNSPAVPSDSSATACKKTNGQSKRQLEEEKENTPPEFSVCSPPSKRAKIVKSITSILP